MSAPENLPKAVSGSLVQDQTRTQAQALFPLESLQHLNHEGALRCQIILGHGGTFGIWETPESLIPHMANSYRHLDLSRRIAAYLPKESPISVALDALIDEGVLWLTRMALLMRMGPAGVGIRARFKPLDASTLALSMHQYLPQLVARGMIRRLENTGSSSTGFASALTAEDIREWWANDFLRANLLRLKQLQGLELWSDAPASREFKRKITEVRGSPLPYSPERIKHPYPAIPDDYLATMGPRVLWLIKDLGPNLIHLLETLSTELHLGNNTSSSTKLVIRHYFETNVWHDRNGQVLLEPPFDLHHSGVRGKHLLKKLSNYSPFEWPPRHWSSVQSLALTLQSAHLWITMLVMAARIGEVATLRRDCIEFAVDGQPYTNGKTYKASRVLAGKEREWPMPEILLEVFAQQIKLVEACERLARVNTNSVALNDSIGDSTHLWASLGCSPNSKPTEKLKNFSENLFVLAKRIGMSPKPGGKNLHPHRFRKTLARLAGLTIDGSQKVLMLLLGHEDITTTLSYMQADPAFAKEIDDITRELRVMRGQALIEDMRAATLDPKSLPYGGHGGSGAPVLADAVRAYEQELHRTGEEWGVNTARDLSVLLTNNGESARLISAYIVCTKVAGEIGLCSKKKGAIIAGNCQTECRNHIEDKAGRRDTERVIPILVQHAQQAIANNDWLPLQRNKRQLEQEIKRYDDIAAQWRDKPEVRAILEAGE